MSHRPSGQAPSRLVAVPGPTNTGETHLAVERMLGHASGMIGLPLRLLAQKPASATPSRGSFKGIRRAGSTNSCRGPIQRPAKPWPLSGEGQRIAPAVQSPHDLATA